MKRKFSLLLSLALIASFLVPSSPVFADGWVSPTGASGTNWGDLSKAYDEDTGTSARTIWPNDIASGAWSEFLELTRASVLCNKLRFYGMTQGSASPYEAGAGTVDLDAYYGDAWHDVYEGSIEVEMELVKHETCQQYFQRRLSEGWKCISLEGYNAVLLSPDGIIKQLDLRNDVLTLRPSAAGAECNIDGGTVACPNHYQAVDEAGSGDNDTTKLSTHSTTYLRDIYALADSGLSGMVINFIRVYFKCYNYGTYGRAMSAMRTNSTSYNGTEQTLSKTWTVFYQQYDTNPATTSAWTWTEIEALQAGVSLKKTGGGFDSRCTQVYVEVDYVPVIDAPTVTTQAVTSIAQTTATGNGNITATGGEDASAWGVCWNTGGSPTTSDSKAAGTGSGGTGAFTASIVSLTSGTKYYVRAYATNTAGTSYGAQVDFTAAVVVPTVTTSDATLTEETTATLNGEVSGGTLPVTERGFEWDIDSGAPYASSWGESAGYGAEAFSHGVTNLSEGTLYYCKAYAINFVGTGYGAEKTFLTKPLAPTSFTATTDVADVDLAWTKGTGAVNTVIRYQLDSYPADIADGAQVYNNTGTAYTHVDPGTGTHYYRAWSYVTNGGLEQYSDAYAEDNAYVEPGLTLWFQPNAMISGTALIDRAGTQNGIIAWGCNDDLTIVIGDTTTFAATTAAGETGETGMITSAGQPEDWYATGTTIENLPFYAQFNIAATAMEMPTQTLYLIMMLGIATAIGLSVLLFTGSTLIAAIATGATILIEVGTTIIGMWMVYVFAILGVGILYLSRQT